MTDEPSHLAATKSTAVFPSVKGNDSLVEGVATLLVSGAMNWYLEVAKDRQSARVTRGAMAASGIKKLLQSLDASAPASTPELGHDAESWIDALAEISGSRSAKEEEFSTSDVERDQLIMWVRSAVVLLRKAPTQARDQGPGVLQALIQSVVRPLLDALAPLTVWTAAAFIEIGKSVGIHGSDDSDFADGLLKLAIDVGSNFEKHKAPVMEAAAALIRLIRSEAPSENTALKEMVARLAARTPALRVTADGPYLFEGNAEIVNHLGVPMELGGCAAFCRCGRSASKPFCDGSHAVVGFNGDKDAHRTADRRDTYAGQQATVFDNRGICAHSGFCTDRLKTVFHLGQEPFVTPSGGRLDDIMRAVRRCPSGALGLGLNHGELRDYVDEPRPPAIEICKDGPYRITGAIALNDAACTPFVRPSGASVEHFSLCRCGSSLNKPFCSGMHWSVKFADPRPPADWEPTLFEWAGGYPALLDMTTIFYSRHVPSDTLIGPLFAKMEPDHPERVAAWLSEVFGGPKFYSERYGGYTRMISQHLDKHLTHEQRAHWALLMAQSADEAGLPNDAEFRAALIGYIEWGSRIAVENSTAGAKPPPNMPVPQWWWVCNAKPNSRVSALAALDEPLPDSHLPLLGTDEKPSFAGHIKELFRAMDRNSMKFAFDLWAYEDVREHADAILSRLRAGTMPCDKAWAPEKVALFEKWIQEDKAK